ncbi:SHOCT domain-containing protein [Smaragdicoccus niigatensis]
MMWGYGMGWGSWLGMTVMMIVFYGVIIFGIIAAVRAFSGTRHSTAGGHGVSSAEQILAARFAKGELTEDEYRQRLATMREIHGSW